MESKTIKVSIENYKWLLAIAAEMQKRHERPISFDDAIMKLKKCGNEKKLSEIAGSWKLSDREAEAIGLDIKKGWKSWKIKSA
jgi:predicted CopG family antitoxin